MSSFINSVSVVAWVELDRWEALTREQRPKFPPIAADLVIELISRSDNLQTLPTQLSGEDVLPGLVLQVPLFTD
ncbi:hypothetical protein QUA40_21750 [Microcoleus sp. Pol11C3]|uniref:hypothetical protein n=1 Tax=Microcoleus sp. Pol11C3 TaxID=3055390 RepID=UPI002FD3F3FD